MESIQLHIREPEFTSIQIPEWVFVKVAEEVEREAKSRVPIDTTGNTPIGSRLSGKTQN